ncbi:MAG: NADH-quinone oxidoreductase subunit M [Nocardioidaceae bacterium]|nr:NADH-quinone oxidoreductase subunit M [Nocardioidaceae bacterium]MCL2613557.1 NADH-quinone oxidoreductase subunit M [Nocardioidaceae bacterium]
MLSVLIAVPLVGAFAVYFLPRELSKVLAIGFSLVTLVIAIVVAFRYKVDGGMQLTETHDWMKQFGVHYALGVDGLGLLMVLLAAVLVPIVLIAEWPALDDPTGGGPKVYAAWALALEAFSLAVFCATDVFLFYVVFEATLIPAYFLVGSFGRPGRGRAALKFLLFQLAGGLILLAAVVGLYVASARAGTPTYLISDLAKIHIDTVTERWLFVGFFTAFAIKAPLFPVHTWLADTTEKATPGTSVLLVCVLDKIGTFGMLRFCLGLFPDASRWATPVVVALALISIVYGALLAIGQDDMLRLIGLTSLSHFGLITLGIFAFSSQGGSGAILYMINHGIGTALLFLTAGYLHRRRGTLSIRELSGQERLTPVLAGLFLVGGLATLGLPGLSTFVSEFLVLLSGFQYHWFVGAIAITAVVLAAIYVLWLYQRTFTGPASPVLEADPVASRDLGVREIAAVVPLVVGLLLFGFVPQPLLNVANPMISDLMSHVGVRDPGPTVAGATGSTNDGGGN